MPVSKFYARMPKYNSHSTRFFMFCLSVQILLLRLYAIWVSLELVVYRIIERDLRAGFADHAGPPMHRLPEENANPQDDVPFPVQKLSGEAEADRQYQGVTDSL